MIQKRKEIQVTADDLRSLFEKQGCRCNVTGRPITDPKDMSLDHIEPKKANGEDDITNLQWVCSEVNKMKGSMAMEELLDWCGRILTHNGYTVERK